MKAEDGCRESDNQLWWTKEKFKVLKNPVFKSLTPINNFKDLLDVRFGKDGNK